MTPENIGSNFAIIFFQVFLFSLIMNIMIQLDQSDNGKTIKAKKGDVLELHLAENPTTGYRWVINSADESLMKVSEKEQHAASDAIGSGGMKIFKIEIIAEGKASLTLSHENTWEKDATETFSVNIES